MPRFVRLSFLSVTAVAGLVAIGAPAAGSATPSLSYAVQTSEDPPAVLWDAYYYRGVHYRYRHGGRYYHYHYHGRYCNGRYHRHHSWYCR